MKVRHSFSRRTGERIDATNKHRKPFPRIAEEVIRNSDIILDVLDARFIAETRNPELEELIKKNNKKIIYVLNKSDLVDVVKLKKDLHVLALYPFVFISCKNRRGSKELRDRIKIEAREIDIKKSKRSGVYKTIKDKVVVGVVGYPNTGKSSVINLLTGKGSAYTSQQSGFTKGVKKIKLSDDILLIDSPGAIPIKEGVNSLQHLKKHGMINVRTWDKIKDPDMIVASLMEKNPRLLEKFYGIDADGDSEILIDLIGKKRRILKKRGEVDVDRVARIILRDWQEGKIKFTN